MINTGLLRSPLYLLVILVISGFSANASARPSAGTCDAEHSISMALPTNASWSMCWSKNDAAGVVFSNIVYTTPDGNSRRVLGDLQLSQIEMQYDDGATADYLLTDFGLGNNLVSQNQNTCENGNILDEGGTGIMCTEQIRRGYMYKYYSVSAQSYALQIRSTSEINGTTITQRWQFFDTGDITTAVGLSGQLQSFSAAEHGWKVNTTDYATGFTLTPIWRMDFDIGNDPNDDSVIEIESRPTDERRKKVLVRTTLETEAARPLDFENKRFWQIIDGSENIGGGRNVFYQLEPLDFADHGPTNLDWLQNDFFVTAFKACEQNAMDNTTENCGSSLIEFIDGQDIANSDIVAWYKTSYHHLPRAEDNNRIPTRWTGYIISPRDWTTDNQFTN